MKTPEHRHGAPTVSSTEDRTKSSMLDTFVLCAVLGVAAVSTSTGSFAALVAIAWTVFRHGAALVARPGVIDLLALVAAGAVLISPYWTHGAANELARASHGPAISLAFFIAARRILANGENLKSFLRGTAVVTFGYAIYFIGNGQVLDAVSSRRTVEFANANYSGAVLVYGLAVSMWMVRGQLSRRTRILGLLSGLVHIWAIIETGSRASLAGAALGVIVIMFGPNTKMYRTVFVGLIAAFSIGFIPGLDTLTLVVSEPLSHLPYLGRNQTSILDASGRFELWASTRSVIADSWFLGWGTDRYRFQPGGPENLAHSWGLEYMASVGLVGTLLLAAILAMSYLTPYRSRSGEGMLLATATSLSLAPSLMLSTHQWTLWLWAAVAVWSRSDFGGGTLPDVSQSLREKRQATPHSDRSQSAPPRPRGRAASSHVGPRGLPQRRG